MVPEPSDVERELPVAVGVDAGRGVDEVEEREARDRRVAHPVLVVVGADLVGLRVHHRRFAGDRHSFREAAHLHDSLI